jgi:hypothetical protein
LNGPVFVGMMGVVRSSERSSERYAPDLDAYHERARTGPCFVCGIVARDPDFFVSLPPGTPYEEQQFAAVMLETAGALDVPEDEKVPLAARIGRRIGG